MTPNELKTTRNMLGMTQNELAHTLGLSKNGDRSIRRWESGKTPIPNPVAIAVNSILNGRT